MTAGSDIAIPLRLGPWTRGLNSWAHPDLVQPPECSEAMNVWFDDSGAARTRPPSQGWSQQPHWWSNNTAIPQMGANRDMSPVVSLDDILSFIYN